MVSAMDSGVSIPGLKPGQGTELHFWAMLYSYSASLHRGVNMGTGEFNVGGNPAMDKHQFI